VSAAAKRPAPGSGGDTAVSATRNRVAVLHGANLDQLGRRPAAHYGTLTLTQLEQQISSWADELGLHAQFFQTNHEGAFVEELHRIEDSVDGLLLNPGAWTHYAWAIRDALEITGLPAVEVHLSDVGAREQWRQTSVIRDACIATVSGKGPEGYRDALVRLRETMQG
jgi:3-dehydroquinate dehydratase-2